jgi:ABC-2 type transport system permease protein
MRREFVTTVARKSFWLTAFLVPVVILVLSLGTQVFAQRSVADTVLPTAGQAQGEPQMGYVDESGIIVRVPPVPDAQALRSYADEALAGAALRRGQISEYYVISKDYLRTGGLTHVTKDYRPLSGANISPLLTYALNYNLTGSEQRALRLLTPIARLDSTFVAPVQRGKAPNDSLAFAVPYAALFILFLVLVTTGGFMLTSVAKEKQNRTAEVLLVSLHPRDLMLGKILGLAGVGLLQMAVWLGVGLVALSQARHLMTSGYSLPGAFVPWALAFFLFGFLLYAAVYAALGVMASTVREASQLVYVALLPLIVPLIV